MNVKKLVSLKALVHRVKQLVLSTSISLAVPVIAMADDTDPFSTATASVDKALNDSSALHHTILAVGLAISLLTGVVTKNWPLAIGGFVVLIVFISVGGSVVGFS